MDSNNINSNINNNNMNNTDNNAGNSSININNAPYPITAVEEREMRRQAYERARGEARILGAGKNKILLIPSLVYALVATLLLYKNFSGITMPFFAIFTFFYVKYITKKLKPDYVEKKGTYAFLAGFILLAIADTYTAHYLLIFYNNAMGFILLVGYLMYVYMEQTGWTLTKYALVFLESLVTTIGTIGDLFGDCSAAMKFNKNEKTKTLVYCVIGVLVFIPLGAVLLALLSSADLIFGNLLENIVETLSIGTCFGIAFFFAFMFAASYCAIRFMDGNKINKEVKDNRTLPTAVANTVLTLINVIYVTFSVIQIASVFLGRMELPDGYTYAEYIHEGFYQLLTVCFLNLCIVLFTKGFFKEHISTKLLLTLVSICTYIMIASAAIRLYMYVMAYDLTLLRIEVAWSLVMIGIAMTFITVSVYFERMKLMHLLCGTAVIGIFALSMLRPDELSVKYNISSGNPIDYEYMMDLSADAAPYVWEVRDESSYAENYFTNLEQEMKEYKSIRKFNFSRYRASEYID